MRVSTGVPGLDQIMQGGLLAGRAYLVYGEPGTGKTTLGLHFLAADPRSALLISFGQSTNLIRTDSASLGLDISEAAVLDFSPPAETFVEAQTYDIFSPSEVEREPISRQISKIIEERRPTRIFVDSFGYFLNFAMDAFHRRRLAQSFFRFAAQHGATVIVSAEERDCARDVDGVIHLEAGSEGRLLQVTKFRGSDFHPGRHPMRLSGEGLQIPLSAA